MLKFNKYYLSLTAFLLCIEIFIALNVHDKIIRPYIGDLLVVILIYCFVKSFLDSQVKNTALAVLLFSYVTEFLQYLNVVDRIGLGNSKVARIIIGASFEWIDLAAYSIGIIIVIFFEKIIFKHT